MAESNNKDMIVLEGISKSFQECRPLTMLPLRSNAAKSIA